MLEKSRGTTVLFIYAEFFIKNNFFRSKFPFLYFIINAKNGVFIPLPFEIFPKKFVIK